MCSPDLFPLPSRITRLAIKVVQVLDLDEVETGFIDALEQLDDLGMADSLVSVVRQETAAPVIGGEGFGHTAGPHLRAAIGNHSQFQAVAAHPLEGFTKLVGGATMPIQEDIYPYQVFLLVGRCAGDRGVGGMLRGAGVVDDLELFGNLA